MPTEPSEGSNSAVVLHAIRRHPSGLSDAQICRLTAISPHQQVNQICHQLAAAGLAERRREAGGPILNVPISTMSNPDDPGPVVRSTTFAQTSSSAGGAHHSTRSPVVDVAERGRTLFVITCSKAKVETTERLSGATVLDRLPVALASELAVNRRRVAPKARVDERSLIPAWRRYGGGFYRTATSVLQEAIASESHVLILSGGYGVVLAGEPVGDYDRAFRSGDWPDLVVQRCVAAYAQHFGLASVVALAAQSTAYAAVIRRVRWPRSVVNSVLVSPSYHGGGAQSVVPKAAGEAFCELWRGGLPASWRDSRGTSFSVETLL